MTAKTYILNFGGYWTEIDSLPTGSGIYCVYACNDISDSTVLLRRLLYIGEAANVRSRVSGHERWNDWSGYLQAHEKLCFNTALISPRQDRERAEAALINKHKPPCNYEYKNRFPFAKTSIQTKGRNGLLQSNFTVYRT